MLLCLFWFFYLNSFRILANHVCVSSSIKGKNKTITRKLFVDIFAALQQVIEAETKDHKNLLKVYVKSSTQPVFTC